MEAVTILRELWRRRALVAAVAVVSALIGLAVAYTISFPPHSRKFEVGIASGRILVDTPDSQVVDVQPKGSGTLGIRAGVLANLMTEGDVKAAIARRAGLRPNQLRAGVMIEGELPTVLTDATGDPNAHLLVTSPAVSPDGTPLPVIDIEAQAPGSRDAARLADAAVTGLHDYLDTKASGEDVPDAKRLQVIGFGAPQVREETRGPSRMAAAAVAIFAFLLGCAAILVAFPLARAWRVAATAEDEEKDDVEESAEMPPASKKHPGRGAWVTALRSHAAGWRARARAWASPGDSSATKKVLQVAQSAPSPSATEPMDKEPGTAPSKVLQVAQSAPSPSATEPMDKEPGTAPSKVLQVAQSAPSPSATEPMDEEPSREGEAKAAGTGSAATRLAGTME